MKPTPIPTPEQARRALEQRKRGGLEGPLTRRLTVEELEACARQSTPKTDV
jgi:hypothetical protein